VVSEYEELRAFVFSIQKRCIAHEHRISSLERQVHALRRAGDAPEPPVRPVRKMGGAQGTLISPHEGGER